MRGGALAARPVALARRAPASTTRAGGIAAPEAPAGGLVALPARHRRNRVVLARAEGEQATSAASADAETDAAACANPPGMFDSKSLPENFCIIEGGDNQVRDFADMDAETLTQNIESRKNKVFIMLEEVRRLRVQAQLREKSADSEIPRPAREYPSVVPGFPRLTENTFNDYYIYWGGCVAFMLLFGGLFAPLAEVKLGLGGTSYMDFIESVNLPRQLAMVDPIVASFTGGAVGAISAFFAIEINNFKEQEKKLCLYCKGSGYLTCAECCTSDRPGRIVDPKSGAKSFCGCCSGTGKVMCTSCLCTGVAMITEHDPRIDPFD